MVFAAGAILLVGWAIHLCMNLMFAVAGVKFAPMILMSIVPVAVGGIAVGSCISMRFFPPNSILYPVLATAALAAIPVGITLSGDTGLIRVAIVLSAVAVAVIFARVSRRGPESQAGRPK